MAYEHEQFQRFLQKENKEKYLSTSPTYYSSPTTAYNTPQLEKRLYTKISTKKSPRIYQQRTVIEYRKNEGEENLNENNDDNKNGKTIKNINSSSNKNFQFLFPSKIKKLALPIVCMKMLLLCCWLLYGKFIL